MIPGVVVNDVQLDGKKEFCCGKELIDDLHDWLCGQYVTNNEKVLCDDCFERTFNKKAPLRLSKHSRNKENGEIS